MTVQPADLYEMLKKVRYDATAIQGKVTDALNMLAELNLPTATELRCPHCDLPFRGRLPLDEHIYNSHGGPVPAHWEAIEARSAEQKPPSTLMAERRG